jgi:ABC-type glycerol-3-phosphate transport system substrate-binding protein
MNDVVSLAGNTVFSKDKNWYKQLLAHKTTFSGTPGWHRALQQVVDMKAANCFDPGVAAIQLPQMLTDFGSGQSEMMFTYGGLNALVLQQDPHLNIGMFSPPGDTAASTTLTTQPSGGMAMWSKTPHKAAALAFLKFMAQPKEIEIFDKLNYLISPADARAGSPPGFYAQLKPFFKSGKIVSAMVSEWPNTQIEPQAGAEMTGLFTGQEMPAQILTDMDRLINLPSNA